MRDLGDRFSSRRALLTTSGHILRAAVSSLSRMESGCCKMETVKDFSVAATDVRSPTGAPAPASPAVSDFMSRMPRKDTGPELRLRRSLHAHGLRFRVGVGSLPGRPDIAFPRAKIAVFVDGCFWHMCPEHCHLPKHNGDWWEAKLMGNRERDKRNDRLLGDMGWLAVHAWEHEDMVNASERIERLWRDRTAPASPRLLSGDGPST